MKNLLIGTALLAIGGLGCQRTYEERPVTREDNASDQVVMPDPETVEITGEPTHGVGGQKQDVNTTQDLGTDDTSEAFGGSGSEGQGDTTEDWGYGGSGSGKAAKDAGTTGAHGANHGDSARHGAGH